MILSGAEIVIECLKEQGVDTVFGYPGANMIDIYDALYGHPEIRHILTCDEQGAAHAADGYARATGKTGVVFATSGPGCTNLVTGIATAYMDSIPMVAITCNVPLALLGKDSFQEIDIMGITIPITKHNAIVKDVHHLAGVLREAFALAKSGRPGPVLIDIPKDITQKACEFIPKSPQKRRLPKKYNEVDLVGAVQLIDESKKPFVLAGGGVVSANAACQLREFADKLKAPVALTLMGIGAFPQDLPNYTGMIGMHGTVASARCAGECDLLIAVGTRFSERVTAEESGFGRHAKILHIDIDAAEINKNIPADHSLCGDAKQILSILNERICAKKEGFLLAQAAEWKKEETPDMAVAKQILKTLQTLVGEDTIYTTEVGQHQIWAAQALKINEPRHFLTPGGLGTMGFGLGAAIGAAIATGKRTIVIAGDGSFHMNFRELATAVAQNLPILILLIENRTLGLVRQWQKVLYHGRYSQTDLDKKTDYSALAKAFGAAAYRLEAPEEAEAVLKQALKEPGPCVVECIVGREERVVPMNPPVQLAGETSGR